ncbi:conserved Plasmodium protein, unknown function [Plasmodium gallinaceum]|uniref:WD repeat-containing protein n=1 Tax=Plasmodium gallinaceum TaxID=5849 RepID=A0A1J1GXL2_PLAGA|nr:conserved Plasmodium protein, unknown function [Plasmodium gallinaceum]CRG97306.1 conserved Plasmodium protein, unknown function [Plasmodium gallinaceum]
MNEDIDEDVVYEDIKSNNDIIDLSSDNELSSYSYENDENDELAEYKKKEISFYVKFYTNKSIYCINSFKKWIYFGSINNKCYIYNNFDNDLKYFVNTINSEKTNEYNFEKKDNLKINLKNLKYQRYSDTVTNIKFSKNNKYVAISIYNGDIYIYENNDYNRSEVLFYNINNIKQNINNSNNLLNIYNWNIEDKEKKEYINEEMKFINILSINDSINKKDLEYFMFCPFNENIILSIYLNSTNIYIWDILESNPINIVHTNNIPTFLNICNYENSFYLIAGFDNGESFVYDYDIYNIKRRNSNKNFEKKKKMEYTEVNNSNKIILSNNTLTNNQLDNVNDVLCIDNHIINEIYISTYKNTIKMYNINNNNIINTYNNLHNDIIDYCLFNNKKNNLFASSSLDNKINIYDFQHNKYINQFDVNYHFNELDKNNKIEKGINFLKWINTNLLLFSSLNGNIYIYDIRLRKCIHQFYCHTDTIFNVNLSLHLYENKNILSVLTASDDNSSNIHFFDISSFI